ncbi:hypothetical protein WR25_06501 [Diploscapter pachys]|uniref:Uncharacterized protein n=1 Tax=Diploscapter pachys TaxID=2018661 RepID=A0A2A2M1Q2_9BILA|nr:hypothetical protein WR25_06501 [Diploscapter pachys]
MRIFDQIEELANDKKCLVFVLIDEIESLGMSRQRSSASNEPVDAIRAVNALLTQIDRIRRNSNVLIMCTSNMDNSLDSALMDRIDFAQSVGLPGSKAALAILQGCISELSRIGKINDTNGSTDNEAQKRLMKLAEEAADKLSARSIRQIPVLACALAHKKSISLDKYVDFLELAMKEKLKKSDIPKSN